MADKKQQVAIRDYVIPEDADSVLLVILRVDERVPEAICLKAGRMTGQMIMGLEGAGIMRIDNELRRAQVEMRRREGLIPPPNTQPIEDRLMQTKENSSA